MPIFAAILRFLVIFAIELAIFFFFYNRPEGRKAVYFSWYAGIIDVLAIFSGGAIMFWSAYALYHPELFTIHVPEWLFWLGFLIGSWQAGIHIIKLVIRTMRRRDK
ncbi:MAG TPA: hypothetical protein VNM40_02780 [Candidatus Paceibacterota bacterium]|nr:hypothetical protein [Candidatus Paceibacterota bacterium]